MLKPFSKSMKRAFVYIATLLVSLTVFGALFGGGKTTYLISSVSAVIEILIAYTSVYLVYAVNNSTASLGAWGFIWRALLMRVTSVVLAATLSVFLFPRRELPSLELTVRLYALTVIFLPASSWLFFSNNRKQQLLSLTNLRLFS